MTRILQNRDPRKTNDIQLAAHASDFVLAGSETTATALSCITYYLLKEPRVMTKLQKEIRGSFKNSKDIDAASTTQLEYLNATIREGLRIYPPLPFPLPREVPNGGAVVESHYIPAGVSGQSTSEPF